MHCASWIRQAALLATLLGLGIPAAVAAPKAPGRSATPPPAAARGWSTPLDFRVVASGPTEPWVLQLRNTSAEPIRIAGDERLLWFEVTVPGRTKTETCRLPSEFLPTRALKRAARVLRPGEVLARRFDPRFFCFSSDVQTILVPGAGVTPYFGWPDATKTTWKGGKRVTVKLPAKKPFVATPLRDPDSDEDDAETAARGLPLKNLTTDPIILDSRYREWTGFRPDDEQDETTADVELRMLRGSDAQSERDASIVLALTNHSDESIQLYFRRGLTEFVVLGPDGPNTCPAEERYSEPDRQAFITIRPKKDYTLTTRLVEVCPRGTFSRPGLYKVSARLEAKEAGENFGLDAFVGELESPTPVLVRIRKGEAPFRVVYRRAPAAGAAPSPAPAPPAPAPAPAPKRAPNAPAAK